LALGLARDSFLAIIDILLCGEIDRQEKRAG
jgi:hypothetical protein